MMADEAGPPAGPGDPDHLLRTRGAVRAVDGHVIACAASRDGRTAAFATGEGELHLASLQPGDGGWRSVAIHDGALLSLAADVLPGGFVTGGDDNALSRIDGDTGIAVRLGQGRRWVEHVATVADGRQSGRGLIAAAAGRQVELRDGGGALLKTLDHDGTVSGIAFDAKGRRLAASHYGGASVWFTASRNGGARRFEWKGSHIGVALHPDGDALVTAMQENELHGWRLADGHTMRMSGYPQKTQSLAFSRTGRWLASSGAEMVVLWPFHGGGPMGKAPTELAGVPSSFCTRVACHPLHDIVAAGFADGTVLMSDITTRRVLPVCGAGNGAVTALGFGAAGSWLMFGTATGRIARVDLSVR